MMMLDITENEIHFRIYVDLVVTNQLAVFFSALAKDTSRDKHHSSIYLRVLIIKEKPTNQEDRMTWSADISLLLSLAARVHNRHMNGVVTVAERETTHKPNSTEADKRGQKCRSRKSVSLSLSF